MADLIDRDALLKDLRSECPECDTCISGEACIDCIVNRQPAVNRWILCNERLPERYIYVLCAGRDGIGILRYTGGTWLDENAIAYTTNEITHWMPLPEPPEVKQDDKR